MQIAHKGIYTTQVYCYLNCGNTEKKTFWAQHIEVKRLYICVEVEFFSLDTI